MTQPLDLFTINLKDKSFQTCNFFQIYSVQITVKCIC